MRIPGLVVPLLPMAVLVVLHPSHASEENAAAFTRAVLEQLSAPIVPCKGSVEGTGPGVVTLCAQWKSDVESFKQAWNAAVDSTRSATLNAKSLSDWQNQVGGRIRWYALQDKWVVATLDSARQIRVTYPKDVPDVLAMHPSITPPRRVPTVQTEADQRRDARRGVRPEATGVVVMSAVILKNGTVGNIEVLDCLPRRSGLEQAAINALKNWRYEPATKDGFPVSVALVSAFTYGPGGTFRVSDGSNEVSSGRSLGAR